MKAGVVFPQTEIGADPVAVRDYVQAAEGLGFSHLIVYDHVLGADTTKHANWTGGYTLESMFHEPFVLFGYLSGITTSIELVTAVLILGQRQTALVAKQAAQCDLLSGGRLRLGVGVGWNHVEYEALGEDFSNRGARQAEQIEVLRQLWTNSVVDFHGKYHDITSAGINPLPIQRPIPIWMGAGARANPSLPTGCCGGWPGWPTAGFRRWASTTLRLSSNAWLSSPKLRAATRPASRWSLASTPPTATRSSGRRRPRLGPGWAQPTSPSTPCAPATSRPKTTSTPSSSSARWWCSDGNQR